MLERKPTFTKLEPRAASAMNNDVKNESKRLVEEEVVDNNNVDEMEQPSTLAYVNMTLSDVRKIASVQSTPAKPKKNSAQNENITIVEMISDGVNPSSLLQSIGSIGSLAEMSKLFEANKEKMKNLIFDRVSSVNMGPFIKSARVLHNSHKYPKQIISRIEPCPVPRSKTSAFPMLQKLNGKTITVEEVLVAENEEIFDICTHAFPIAEIPKNYDIVDLNLTPRKVEEPQTALIKKIEDKKKIKANIEEMQFELWKHSQNNKDAVKIATLDQLSSNVEQELNIDPTIFEELVEFEDYKTLPDETINKWSKVCNSK